MCGIAGIACPAQTGMIDTGVLKQMTSVLAHRGPDEDGIHVGAHVGLGHRRLRIIDLEGGRQPMFNEDGAIVIVFNGEIYNFQALRRELLVRGHEFVTHSDTEVILHAYEEYGEQCVARLRGMFAFAIWDDRRRQLFLARDRLGIKPLYYRWDGRVLHFGSELKAILEDPGVPRELDFEALDDYLTYLYVPAPKTIFRGIRKLRPGYTLTVSDSGIQESRYWDLSFEPDSNMGERDWVEGLGEKLRESVGTHLMSDVPLGAFLSGGLDSSAVVATMAQLMDRPVDAAAIGFLEADYDELPYARLAARSFGARIHERAIRPKAAEILDELVWFYDEPFADSSMVPTYYVSQAAREQVTVCLSGDGGDENFAGYRRYRFDVFENRIRALLPPSIRKSVFGTLGRIYPKADWLPRPLRAKTLLTNLATSPERGYFHTMSWFTPAMKRRLYGEPIRRSLGDYDSFSVLQQHFQHAEGWDPLSRVQYVDMKTYLVDDILTKVDRASMAHALEVRVPLLDHEFVEYAARIPARLKLHDGEGKYIFKQALIGSVPDEILQRRKMGFSIPLGTWLRRELKIMFEQRVLGPDAFLGGLFNRGPIEEWWRQHQRGTRDYAYHLWALLVLECWGRRFRVGGL